MTQKFANGLLLLLGLGLPLHGALTVFGPDWLRWWKEAVLLGLVVVLLCEFKKLKNKFNFTPKFLTTSPVTYAVLFLVWLEILAWISSDFVTGLIAARYLSLGFLVFLLIWGLSQAFDGKKLLHKFSTGLTSGVLFSLAFGFWAQFLGGFKFLEKWYSTTISSWVPGQTLPLYHQTSEGMVRMQGMSSGPIEFSHLLVLTLFLFLKNPPKSPFHKGGIILFLLWGILLSGSRSALLVALIVTVFYVGRNLKNKLPLTRPILHPSVAVNAVLVLVMMIAGLGGLKYIVTELPDSYLQKVVRLSDLDHITRPLEALQMGAASPVIGNLGQLGPAARAKNMQEKNTDQAPIAENVFVDYFAQLGLLGVLFSVLFWGSWFFRVRDIEYWIMGVSMLVMMNLATILDMTPIAISFFVILAFAGSLPKKKTN